MSRPSTPKTTRCGVVTRLPISSPRRGSGRWPRCGRSRRALRDSAGGRSSPGGEPSLHDREVVPALGADVPAAWRRRSGRRCEASRPRCPCFGGTLVVVVLELLDPVAEGVDQAAVAREAELHVELGHLPQAAHEQVQRIVVVGPGLDVRRDVAENVVAGDEQALGAVVERDVAEGVARSVDDLEPVVADLDEVAFVERQILDVGSGPPLRRGVVAERVLQLVGGKAAAGQVLAHVAVCGPAELPELGGRVAGAHVGLPAVLQELRDETAVVCVQVRGQEVGALEIDAELVEARVERLPTFGAVHAGVDDQVPIATGQDVGVDLSEGVPGKRDDDPIEPGEYPFGHGCSVPARFGSEPFRFRCARCGANPIGGGSWAPASVPVRSRCPGGRSGGPGCRRATEFSPRTRRARSRR